MLVIAVFGLSGVGKSTFINNFLKSAPQWTHLQAGSLIKEALKSVDRDELRLSGNKRILENQKLMIEKFWEAALHASQHKIIFDGHSIIDTGEEVLLIPVEIISALKPNLLIFIQADPNVIHARRLEDQSRKRPSLDTDALSAQQEIAYSQVLHYGESLEIPVVRLESAQTVEFSEIVNKLEIKGI